MRPAPFVCSAAARSPLKDSSGCLPTQSRPEGHGLTSPDGAAACTAAPNATFDCAKCHCAPNATLDCVDVHLRVVVPEGL